MTYRDRNYRLVADSRLEVRSLLPGGLDGLKISGQSSSLNTIDLGNCTSAMEDRNLL
jgi:hypothetical protein